MPNLKLLGAIVLLPVLIGCSPQQPPVDDEAKIRADSAKAQMIGMSKEEDFTCLGAPKKKSTAGTVEIWSYTYGACTVNLTIAGDNRVKTVTYKVPASDTLTEGEQCAQVPEVSSCLRWLRNGGSLSATGQ